MCETKVNLKHLLEDIRDSYTIPIEEIILLELIANALDSGASRVDFFVEPDKKTLTAVDNGKGMKRRDLSDYHNIAATTKTKGKGIGFAGIGAKLSLLVAEKVCTETKGGHGSRCATEWYLKNEISAPWKFVPFSNKDLSSRGTSVSIQFKDNSSLLSEEFVVKSARNHFYPLFYPDLFGLIFKNIYKKGIGFYVDGRKIVAENIFISKLKTFQIRLSRSKRVLVGIGFLGKVETKNNFEFQGLGVSTYGKVIKSGWEWIGVEPVRKEGIFGLVEIPAMSGILTMNKMDFLRDSASLKKYYQYRKAIQESVAPILKSLGEDLNLSALKTQYRSLSKDIERTLRSIIIDFPELTPLLGIKKSNSKNDVLGESLNPALVEIVEKEIIQNDKEPGEGDRSSKKETKENFSAEVKKGAKKPSLLIGFENRKEKDPLARMIESKIWINSSHPSYAKAKQEKLEQYHILFCTALTLSSFLQNQHSSHKFINEFMSAWGKDTKKTIPLLRSYA
ncbi:MAG: ATP-binding protein [bacterium]